VRKICTTSVQWIPQTSRQEMQQDVQAFVELIHLYAYKKYFNNGCHHIHRDIQVGNRQFGFIESANVRCFRWHHNFCSPRIFRRRSTNTSFRWSWTIHMSNNKNLNGLYHIRMLTDTVYMPHAIRNRHKGDKKQFYLDFFQYFPQHQHHNRSGFSV
jgi:hypothetical protein